MGIILSTTKTSPLSLISVVIGFLSFAFTLGTFLRVVWVNLMTLSDAQHEVHSYLTNLRQELIEERASLRVIRKACRYRKRHPHRHSNDAYEELLSIQLDDHDVKTMSDLVRGLIKRFQELERPFLEPGEQGIAQATRHGRRRSASPYYAHSAYSPGDEKYASRGEQERDDVPDEERYWPQRVQYKNYSLRLKFVWLARKSEAQQLVETLTRVQTRRIARQVGELSVLLYEHGGGIRRMDGRMERIEDRISRVVGVRRISGD